jgi:hypothetical protein
MICTMLGAIGDAAVRTFLYRLATAKAGRGGVDTESEGPNKYASPIGAR